MRLVGSLYYLMCSRIPTGNQEIFMENKVSEIATSPKSERLSDWQTSATHAKKLKVWLNSGASQYRRAFESC